MNDTVYHLEKLSFDLLSMGYPALIAFILAGTAFAVWYYRDTVPPVSGLLKWTLITLRAAAVSLLKAAIGEIAGRLAGQVCAEGRDHSRTAAAARDRPPQSRRTGKAAGRRPGQSRGSEMEPP